MINVFSDGGDGSIVLVPYELVAIQDKLRLLAEGQAYGFLMDNNVPNGCSDGSSARQKAVRAVHIWMSGGMVDFGRRLSIILHTRRHEVLVSL